MKKALSVTLALIMVLAMGVVAFAESGDTDFNIPVYYLATNPGSEKPGVTYTLTIAGEEANADAPAFASKTATAVFSKSSNAEDVQFPVFTVLKSSLKKAGVYNYTITETASDDFAGLTLDEKTASLTVYVLLDDQTGELTPQIIVKYDDEKVEGGEYDEDDQVYKKGEQTSPANSVFTNIYAAAAEDTPTEAKGVSVSKIVAGNMGDQNKEFTVTVTFTSAKKVALPITYTVGATPAEITLVKDNDVYTATKDITLKHGATVNFNNVPYGVTYSVAEADYSAEGYTTTYKLDGAAADAIADVTVEAPSSEVEITNTNGTDVDTGVVLDFLPYVLVLAFVAGIGAFVVIKRRKAAEEY